MHAKILFLALVTLIGRQASAILSDLKADEPTERALCEVELSGKDVTTAFALLDTVAFNKPFVLLDPISVDVKPAAYKVLGIEPWAEHDPANLMLFVKYGNPLQVSSALVNPDTNQTLVTDHLVSPQLIGLRGVRLSTSQSQLPYEKIKELAEQETRENLIGGWVGQAEAADGTRTYMSMYREKMDFNRGYMIVLGIDTPCDRVGEFVAAAEVTVIHRAEDQLCRVPLLWFWRFDHTQ